MRARRRLPVERFDAATGRWREVHAPAPVERDGLTVTTFNVWFDEHYADHRYRAMAALLCDVMPDVMVFQEVTPAALEVFLTQSWVREHYLASSITGADVGNYGMLLLTRVPVDGVTYTRLPTRLDRGYLRADLTVNGAALAVCGVHLDSGKRSARLRARQLRTLFRAVRGADEAVLLGDFNMRDAENPRITAPFIDVWPALRRGEDGFTEDTSINLMRYDSKNKHRHVRFDRVLVKGRRWHAVGIDLLGTRPVSEALPRVFPSDHFGVVCRLAHLPAAPARPPWWRRAGSRVG
ncbi:endonuclease/exonuclease/phosphatase family protein [Mycobacterium manitobense]|uniref:Endonuclease/exonuclease/phosphatase family protein n=1 Tax=[Mycobacterium] manitobense TaxID=190147 RepID=A0A9X2YSD9_9MYCO|nr:endonuclease/exonuclease/phosphatase family protein [[Mycobacterium] manitobense]MCV7172675.1 endonuclease/exonuclease/phosphatase family protein [[Mycobacterium] manitobense]